MVAICLVLKTKARIFFFLFLNTNPCAKFIPHRINTDFSS